MPFEGSFETWRISVMRGSRQVLVKVVLFQLRGHGQVHNDAMPNFLLILNALYKGLQMRYQLLQKFFEKVVKIKKKRLSSWVSVWSESASIVSSRIFMHLSLPMQIVIVVTLSLLLPFNCASGHVPFAHYDVWMCLHDSNFSSVPLLNKLFRLISHWKWEPQTLHLRKFFFWWTDLMWLFSSLILITFEFSDFPDCSFSDSKS